MTYKIIVYFQTFFRKLNFHLSIKKKALIGYFFIIILPFSIFSFYLFSQTVGSIRQDYLKNMIQVEDFVNKMVTQKAQEMEFISNSIADNSTLKKILQYYSSDDTYYQYEMFSDLTPYFDGIQNFNNDIFKINVFYENNELYNFRMIFYNKKLIEDAPAYKEACKKSFREVLWESQHNYVNYEDLIYKNNSGEASNEKVFSVYRKIMSQNYTRQVGMLKLDIKTSKLLQGLDELEMKNKDNILLILDNNGQVVYQYGKIPNQYGELLQQVKNNPSNNFDIKFTDSGTKFWGAYIKTEKIGLNIFYLIPAKNLTQVLLQRLISFILPFALILFSLIFFIYFLSALIFKRLAYLSETMGKIQTGDFDIQIEVNSMDEIGQLKNVFNTMVNRVNHLFNTIYKLQYAEKVAALSFLQSQMNPHFLYNTLETIRMMAEFDRNKRISNAVVLLSKLLKYNIKIDTPVSIKDEIDMVQCYVSIQNLRFNNKITFNTTIEETLKNQPIIKLIIQPLVENSISYGFQDMLENCMINISVYREDCDLVIIVEDNGFGFSPERLEEINELLRGNKDESTVSMRGNGIGLLNINTRLKLHYGEATRVSITSRQREKTDVTLRIKYFIL